MEEILLENVEILEEILTNLCVKYSREMSTEIKLIYDVQKNNLNVEYKYDFVYYNNPVKTADDV